MAGVDELTGAIRVRARRLVTGVCLREHEASQRLGLGGTDVRFLTLLDHHGPLTPGRLAALTGLTTGSVTGVIDRLERAGFVGRERDVADRRKVRVVPAPEAAARLAGEWRGVLDPHEDLHGGPDPLGRVLAPRGRAELEVIFRFLGDLVRELDEPWAHDGRAMPADQEGSGVGASSGTAV